MGDSWNCINKGYYNGVDEGITRYDPSPDSFTKYYKSVGESKDHSLTIARCQGPYVYASQSEEIFNNELTIFNAITRFFGRDQIQNTEWEWSSPCSSKMEHINWQMAGLLFHTSMIHQEKSVEQQPLLIAPVWNEPMEWELTIWLKYGYWQTHKPNLPMLWLRSIPLTCGAVAKITIGTYCLELTVFGGSINNKLTGPLPILLNKVEALDSFLVRRCSKSHQIQFQPLSQSWEGTGRGSLIFGPSLTKSSLQPIIPLSLLVCLSSSMIWEGALGNGQSDSNDAFMGIFENMQQNPFDPDEAFNDGSGVELLLTIVWVREQ